MKMKQIRTSTNTHTTNIVHVLSCMFSFLNPFNAIVIVVILVKSSSSVVVLVMLKKFFKMNGELKIKLAIKSKVRDALLLNGIFNGCAGRDSHKPSPNKVATPNLEENAIL